MLRGYYTCANGIINEQRILNIITNNMANVSTAGYKSEIAIPTTFAEQLLLIRGDHSETGTIRYRTLQETFTNLEQSSWEQTGSRLDVALVGNIYLNIQNRKTGEVLLTRNGQFAIDGEGYLCLGPSGRILDENRQPIYLGTADIDIDRRGLITVDDGREIQLGLTYLPPDTDIERIDDNMFRPYEDFGVNNIPADERYRVIHKAYERSNVDVAEETIRAMDSQHVFTACSQALKIANSINQIAANDLASIQ